MACCHNPSAGGPRLMLLSLSAFLALLLGIDASISGASGILDAINPSTAAAQSSNRRLLQTPKVPKKRPAPIKFKATSSGDDFSISSDLFTDTGSTFLSLGGFTRLSKDSDVPTPTPSASTFFSLFSCQQAPFACTDIWGSTESFSLSVDPRTMSATASASFTAFKRLPGDNADIPQLSVAVSYSLTLPCNRVNITKFSSGCNDKTTNQPTFTSKSSFRSGSTRCQINIASITGSILVDGVDVLSTVVKNSDAGFTSSASTSKSQSTSVSFTKGFLF